MECIKVFLAEAQSSQRNLFWNVCLVKRGERIWVGRGLQIRASGNMVETSIFSQWQHAEHFSLYYARWNNGEVDIVYLDSGQKPDWVVEIKWSNRFAENPIELKNLKFFCLKHEMEKSLVTTINIQKELLFEGFTYEFVPASLYCYVVGRNIVESKTKKE